MKSTKEHGFSAALIVIAVVAVAVIGLIIWRVSESNKTAQPSNTAETGTPEIANEQPSTQPVDPNAGYVVIKEWGVRLKPVDGLTGVQYFKPSSVTDDAISITTEELGKADPACSTSSSSMVLGLLTRSKDPQSYNGGVLAKIGEYSYQYRVSSARCSTSEATGDLESKTRNLIRESLKSLEAAK